MHSNRQIKSAIVRSQHCQRNWDLEKEISPQDLETLAAAVTECPSKQNIAFYSVHFIFNREVIEDIHSYTEGFQIRCDQNRITTNPQTLANLLVVFEKANPSARKDVPINMQLKARIENHTHSSGGQKAEEILRRDQEMAVGVAAGYLNLTASLLGYSTGCCACFDLDKVQRRLGLISEPVLLMGIGYRDESRGRRKHHQDNSIIFPAIRKQPIEINIVR